MNRTLLSSALILLASSPAFAQRPGGGVHTFHPHQGIIATGMSRAPVIIPATVARQSALPLIAPPVSPILGRGLGYRNAFGGYGGYGGYGGGYGGYGYGGYYGGFGSFGGGYPYYSSSTQVDNNNNYNLDYSYQGPIGSPNSLLPLPPLANDHPYTARLSLRVPLGAEVWLQGKKIEMGSSRTFESPELNPGQTFAFDLRINWMENGKAVEEKRTLSMQPGDLQSLQFLGSPTTIQRIDR